MLYGTTHEGVARLEYFDNPEAMVTSSGKRTIPLRDCTDITATIGSKVHPYAFHFTSQLGQFLLIEHFKKQARKISHVIKLFRSNILII